MGIIIQGQPFGMAPLNAQGGRTLTYGNRKLPEDCGFAVNVVSFTVQPKKNDPTKGVGHFEVELTEPGFEGVTRAIYSGLPEPIIGNEDPKVIRSKQFVHNDWLTILASLGYNDQQIAQIAARGIQTTDIQNAPGGGKAFMFVEYEAQAMLDDITKQPLTDPRTGMPVTRDSENRHFMTRENYLKTAASQKLAREKQQQVASAASQPTFAPNPGGYAPQQPQPQPQQFAPAPTPVPVAPQYAQPQGYAAPQPPSGFAPPPPPTGYAPAPQPNGVYGQQPVAPLMGVLTQPPRTP